MPPFFYPFTLEALPPYPAIVTFFCSFPSSFFSELKWALCLCWKVATDLTTLCNMTFFSSGLSYLVWARLLPLGGVGGNPLSTVPLMIGFGFINFVLFSNIKYKLQSINLELYHLASSPHTLFISLARNTDWPKYVYADISDIFLYESLGILPLSYSRRCCLVYSLKAFPLLNFFKS